MEKSIWKLASENSGEKGKDSRSLCPAAKSINSIDRKSVEFLFQEIERAYSRTKTLVRNVTKKEKVKRVARISEQYLLNFRREIKEYVLWYFPLQWACACCSPSQIGVFGSQII